MEYERRREDATLLVVVEKISALHGDLGDLKLSMKTSIDKVTDAVTKLVLIEERQSNLNASYERVAKQLEKTENKYEALETRLDTLEREVPMQQTITKWVVGAVIGAAAMAVTMLMKFVGVL